MMRAYRLCIAIILFNLSLPLVAVLGFNPPAAGYVPSVATTADALAGFVMTGVGVFTIGVVAIASLLGFRISVGAIVFAVVFTISSLPFSATLQRLAETFTLDTTFIGIITGALSFVYVFGFIQLAGAPVGE
jgi:hypothetical protein